MPDPLALKPFVPYAGAVACALLLYLAAKFGYKALVWWDVNQQWAVEWIGSTMWRYPTGALAWYIVLTDAQLRLTRQAKGWGRLTNGRWHRNYTTEGVPKGVERGSLLPRLEDEPDLPIHRYGL